MPKYSALELEILVQARNFFCNPKLKHSEIQEWSTGDIEPHKGETVVKLPNGCRVAVKFESDKRAEVNR